MATVFASQQTLSCEEVDRLDPYAFFAVLGKRVIHPGGRTPTDALIRADFQAGQQVLEVGCGVVATAIRVAGRIGAQVTAVDIAGSCWSAPT